MKAILIWEFTRTPEGSVTMERECLNFNILPPIDTVFSFNLDQNTIHANVKEIEINLCGDEPLLEITLNPEDYLDDFTGNFGHDEAEDEKLRTSAEQVESWSVHKNAFINAGWNFIKD